MKTIGPYQLNLIKPVWMSFCCLSIYKNKYEAGLLILSIFFSWKKKKNFHRLREEILASIFALAPNTLVSVFFSVLWELSSSILLHLSSSCWQHFIEDLSFRKRYELQGAKLLGADIPEWYCTPTKIHCVVENLLCFSFIVTNDPRAHLVVSHCWLPSWAVRSLLMYDQVSSRKHSQL